MIERGLSIEMSLETKGKWSWSNRKLTLNMVSSVNQVCEDNWESGWEREIETIVYSLSILPEKLNWLVPTRRKEGKKTFGEDYVTIFIAYKPKDIILRIGIKTVLIKDVLKYSQFLCSWSNPHEEHFTEDWPRGMWGRKLLLVLFRTKFTHALTISVKIFWISILYSFWDFILLKYW